MRGLLRKLYHRGGTGSGLAPLLCFLRSCLRRSLSTATLPLPLLSRCHHRNNTNPKIVPMGGSPPPPRTPPPYPPNGGGRGRDEEGAASSSWSTISPQQRQRMEANRRLALSRRHLSPQQRLVLDAVARGESVFVTGPGGTGKTFLLRHIIALLRDARPPGTVFVTASTGVAACALDGQTLHSFAGIGLGAGDADSLSFKAAGDPLATRRWRRAKALVIDEVSMVDGELFDKLDGIARRMRPVGAGLPWGGIQLVVSGDFFQLPPIKPPNPSKEFAFEADCWPACFHRQVELTHVFRQSDARLVDLLQGIRRGRSDDLDLCLLQCCTTASHRDSDQDLHVHVPHLFPRNEDVRRVNNERLRSLGGEIITYRAIDTGAEPWRSQLRQGIAPEELHLCLGSRVMLIKNTDLKIGLVNGATGIVTGFVEQLQQQQQANGSWLKSSSSICSKGVLPRVRFDTGLEMVVEPERWDVMEGEAVQATRRQIPLILSWALSIHKCQGMTLQRLHTDLSRAFGCGMVYVAISRVQSLEGLHLSGFNPRKIKAHPKVIQFYNRLLGSQA